MTSSSPVVGEHADDPRNLTTLVAMRAALIADGSVVYLFPHEERTLLESASRLAGCLR